MDATPAGRHCRRSSSRTRSTTCRSSRSRCTGAGYDAERAAPGRRASRGRDPHRARRRRDVRRRRRAEAVPRDARSGATRRERGHAGRGRDGAPGRERAAARRASSPPADQVYHIDVGAPARDRGRRRAASSWRTRGGAPVYLRNVADVADGFGETTTYVSHAERRAARRSPRSRSRWPSAKAPTRRRSRARCWRASSSAGTSAAAATFGST